MRTSSSKAVTVSNPLVFIPMYKSIKIKIKEPKFKLQDSYTFQGLPISIENKAGSFRRSLPGEKPKWETKMGYDYGYIRNTEAKDKEAVDVYVNRKSGGKKKPYHDVAGGEMVDQGVYVIHQKQIWKTGKWNNGICPDCKKHHTECKHAYDEDKVMLGFDSKEDAIKGYLEQYDSPRFLGPVSTYTLQEFKATLKRSFGKKLPYKNGKHEHWVGVDLDGTMAEDHGWKGKEHIGEPIPKMVERIEKLLKQGQKVKIFTARAYKKDAIKPIQEWMKLNNIPLLEITNKKDPGMIELYDDRARRIGKNTGNLIKSVLNTYYINLEKSFLIFNDKDKVSKHPTNFPSRFDIGEFVIFIPENGIRIKSVISRVSFDSGGKVIYDLIGLNDYADINGIYSQRVISPNENELKNTNIKNIINIREIMVYGMTLDEYRKKNNIKPLKEMEKSCGKPHKPYMVKGCMKKEYTSKQDGMEKSYLGQEGDPHGSRSMLRENIVGKPYSIKKATSTMTEALDDIDKSYKDNAMPGEDIHDYTRRYMRENSSRQVDEMHNRSQSGIMEKAFVKATTFTTKKGTKINRKAYVDKRQKKITHVKHSKMTRMDLSGDEARAKIEELKKKKKHHDLHIEAAKDLKEKVEAHKGTGNSHYVIGDKLHPIEKILNDVNDHIKHHTNEKESHDNHIKKIEERHETEAKHWEKKGEKAEAKKGEKKPSGLTFSDQKEYMAWYRKQPKSVQGEGGHQLKREGGKLVVTLGKEKPVAEKPEKKVVVAKKEEKPLPEKAVVVKKEEKPGGLSKEEFIKKAKTVELNGSHVIKVGNKYVNFSSVSGHYLGQRNNAQKMLKEFANRPETLVTIYGSMAQRLEKLSPTKKEPEKSEAEKTKTRSEAMIGNQNAWKGLSESEIALKYPFGIKQEEIDLDTKAAAKRIRTDIKEAIKNGDLPEGTKVSVKMQRYSMGSSIDLRVTSLPDGVSIMNPYRVKFEKENPHKSAGTLPDDHKALFIHSDDGRAIKQTLEAIKDQYNYGKGEKNKNFYGGADFDYKLRNEDRAKIEKEVEKGKYSDIDEPKEKVKEKKVKPPETKMIDGREYHKEKGTGIWVTKTPSGSMTESGFLNHTWKLGYGLAISGKPYLAPKAIEAGEKWLADLKGRSVTDEGAIKTIENALDELKEMIPKEKPKLKIVPPKEIVVPKEKELDYSKIKVGREDYQDRKEARIDRLENKADKAEQESSSRHQTATDIAARFPFGQPILVGHHSEKKARRDQEKMHSNMDRAVQASKKADEYKDKAEAAKSNRAISSDDPEAVVKLKEKLDGLQVRQETMKKVNAAWRKFKKNPDSLDKSDLTDNQKNTIKLFQPEYSWDKGPYASYEITNNGANIRNTKQRLDDMVSSAGAETKTMYDKNDIKITDNVESNRIQVDFPGKPSEGIRKVLKSNGFRWAPSEGVWQRKRSANANYVVKNFLIKELESMSKSLKIPSMLLFGVN